MTTFDEVMDSFIINCKVSRSLIPTSSEVLVIWIDNAIKYYNNIIKPYANDFQYPITANKDMEELSVVATDDELLIISNILKLIFLKNEKTSFVSRYGVFQKEFGINNYNAQASAKDLEVIEQEKAIKELIVNALDDWSVC